MNPAPGGEHQYYGWGLPSKRMHFACFPAQSFASVTFCVLSGVDRVTIKLVSSWSKRLRRSQTTPDHRSGARSPARQWLTASLCLLLVLFSSTLQAVHAHGDPHRAGRAQVSAQLPGAHNQTEELCPLCAAMHSALASPQSPVFREGANDVVALHVGSTVFPLRVWSFDLFSRPPPAHL